MSRTAMCVALLALPLLIAVSAAAPAPSLKIVIRETWFDRISETVEYIQSDRRRMEFRTSGDQDPHTFSTRHVSITRCDLRREFHLLIDSREFTASPIVRYLAPAQAVRSKSARQASHRAATLLITVRTEDTGERKVLHGRIRAA